MSATIVAVISHLTQLRGSLRHTAQRLGYYADETGRIEKSFSALAADLHVSVSTPKRHIPRLIEAGILKKDPPRRLSPTRYAVNIYRFTDWVMKLVHKRSSSKVRQPNQQREKTSSRARENPRPEAERWWYDLYAATHGLGYGGMRSP